MCTLTDTLSFFLFYSKYNILTTLFMQTTENNKLLHYSHHCCMETSFEDDN